MTDIKVNTPTLKYCALEGYMYAIRTTINQEQ